MKKSFSRIGSGVAGLVLLLAIICAASLILKNLRLRADCTEEGLFTLSSGSKAILGKLEKNVTLKFYFSSSSAEMPRSLKNYAEHVLDYLREYELAGKGRINVEVFDPAPDSDAEEWAQRYGIQPQQTSMFGAPVYFGLVASCGDEVEVIPGFDARGEATLEYDITRLITRAVWTEKPVIGVMSPLNVLPDNGGGMMMPQMQRSRGWIMFRELAKDYTVRSVPMDAAEIEKDVKLLIVVHPRDIADSALYAIDQFVLGGGRAVICVDPFSATEFLASRNQQQMMMMPPQLKPSTLGKVFEAWGVNYDPERAVADISLSTKLNGGDGRVDDNPSFLSLGADNAIKGELIVSGLSSAMFPFCGALEGKNTDELKFFQVLVSSQDKACLVDRRSAQFGMGAMRGELKPDGVERVLAARLEGTFKTAFPEGYSEGTNKTAAAEGHLKSGKSAVMIFGDSDFLFDMFAVQEQRTLFGDILQPMNDNLALFANTIERYAGREELIGIRSRGLSNRPFEKVDALEDRAMIKWQAEEERLQGLLEETRTKLRALQERKSGKEKFLLSKEQQKELEAFLDQQQRTQRELKAVRKHLHADIDRLGVWLKIINIILVPVAVVVFGIVRGIYRRRK